MRRAQSPDSRIAPASDMPYSARRRLGPFRQKANPIYRRHTKFKNEAVAIALEAREFSRESLAHECLELSAYQPTISLIEPRLVATIVSEPPVGMKPTALMSALPTKMPLFDGTLVAYLAEMSFTRSLTSAQ